MTTGNATFNSEEIMRLEALIHSMEVQNNKGDDATWILTSSFIILTMQTGFGFLEAGHVHGKHRVNIMMKNVVDVGAAGLAFYILGYGLAYGEPSNWFAGYGNFLLDGFHKADNDARGMKLSHYFFQFSFAAASTTIVSGIVAARIKFKAYILFSFFNTFSYAIAAHWVWARGGWLYEEGYVDFAGDGPVHLLGGVSGLVCTYVLGPRAGRFEPATRDIVRSGGDPTHALVGLFMLWWGWLGFNCGSSFGISDNKWLVATRASVNTVNGSIGGALFGSLYSMYFYRGHFTVDVMVNTILGGLVAITSGCAYITPHESIFIGAIGGVFAMRTGSLLERLEIDDPVGGVGVHCSAAIWGLIATGLFADKSLLMGQGKDELAMDGLLRGGGLHLLAVQLSGVAAIMAWGVVSSLAIMGFVQLVVPLRVSPGHEERGLDLTEHLVGVLDRSVDFEASPTLRRSGSPPSSPGVLGISQTSTPPHLEIKMMGDFQLTEAGTAEAGGLFGDIWERGVVEPPRSSQHKPKKDDSVLPASKGLDVEQAGTVIMGDTRHHGVEETSTRMRSAPKTLWLTQALGCCEARLDMPRAEEELTRVEGPPV